MSYSQRQRQLITMLTERGSMTVVEFLLSIAGETCEVDAQQWQDVVSAAPGRYHMFIPQWNNRSAWLLFGISPNAHLEVLEFFTLMRDLHARKLVTIITDPKRHVRASAIAGSMHSPIAYEADAAALEIDALLQTPSEVLGLSISSERVYVLPALHELRARQFVGAEESMAARQRDLLQTQQNTLSRLVPLVTLAVVACVIVIGFGFYVIRSSSVKSPVGKAPEVRPETAAPTRVIIQRDTIVIRDTVIAKPKPARKSRKLWYME